MNTKKLETVKGSVRTIILGTSKKSDGNWFVKYYSPESAFSYQSLNLLNEPCCQSRTASAGIKIRSFKPVKPNLVARPKGKFNYSAHRVCVEYKRKKMVDGSFTYRERWAVILQQGKISSRKGAI